MLSKSIKVSIVLIAIVVAQDDDNDRMQAEPNTSDDVRKEYKWEWQSMIEEDEDFKAEYKKTIEVVPSVRPRRAYCRM